MNVIKNKVKHSIIIKYEDLRDDYEKTLNKLMGSFYLRKRHAVYEKILKYKGCYTAFYNKKPILLSEESIRYIKDNVDKDQEAKIGYIID